MGKSRGLPVARPAAEPWHPRSSTFVGSSSPGTPVLVRDSPPGLVERLDAGENARAPVIGTTVEDEPLIGAERYFVTHSTRADNHDSGNPIRGDTREHPPRGRCADMPGAAEEQLGWATPSSRTLSGREDEQAYARADGRVEVAVPNRLLEDVDAPGPLRTLQGGDSAAVVRESVAGDALEVLRQPIACYRRSCERGWNRGRGCTGRSSRERCAEGGCKKSSADHGHSSLARGAHDGTCQTTLAHLRCRSASRDARVRRRGLLTAPAQAAGGSGSSSSSASRRCRTLRESTPTRRC